MGEEFKDFEVEAPVLTLEPDLTEEKEKIAKKDLEETLIDDVSYAVIKYDELDPGCPVVWIFPEEREETDL